MKFIHAAKTEAVQAIYKHLNDCLSHGERVLWLTSGGSNIPLQIEIMNQLRKANSEKLSLLTIMPMDERYGPAGHADSNTQQMREADFDPGEATWIDVLGSNLPLSETVGYYAQLVSDAFAAADVVIGQFGMGDDAHIAGIKPDSPAAEDDPSTLIGYEWSDYTRITMGPEALKQVMVAYVPAYGESKRTALERLQQNKETFQKLPAKLLYELPEVYVYTDIDIWGDGRLS